MKRSRGGKSKSASGQSKASSSPAKAAIGTRPRKRTVRKSPDETSSNAADDLVTNQPQENVTDSTALAGTANKDEDRASSPDPNCSICLCKMEDKSFTHSCFHMFCFTCLLEWSKIKAECPLCKQSFNSIIHNIRSESDYDVYYLRDAAVASPPAVSTDDDVQLHPFMFGRSPLRPWTPLLTPIDLQLLADFRTTAHGLTQGFFTDEAFHIFQHMEGRNQIYRDERWAQEINLPPGLSYRNVSPEYFTASAGTEYWQRIAIWLDRELATLSRHNVAMRNHVRDYIMHLLQRCDVRSVNFYAEVEPFFGSQTRLFINQLYNFVRSPLTIRETDHQTVYSDQPPTPPESEVITLDRDDSDIEIVSPDGTEAARRRRHHIEDWPHNVLDPFFSLPSRPMVVVGADDALRVNSPIAGPSGLFGRQQTNIPDRDFPWTFDCNATDLHEVSDTESSSTSHCDNEIVVVGFDKPWRARSPISLSSDGSDIEVDEGCTDTEPSSSNKSPESEVRLQSSSQNGPEVEITKAPDAEGDTSSRPWSEFSPDALSEVSSGGSFDKSLACFLRSSNPFIGFEHHFAPERGPEVFEQSGDCIHASRGICKQCKEESVVSGNESKVLTENSFLLKRQSRKRNRDDCGDSGVVVDVAQFGDSEEPLPKKSAYKKHYRGHKKSANRPESSLDSDGNHTRTQSEEPAIVGPCSKAVDVNGSSSATQELELLSSTNCISLSHEVSDGTMSSLLKPELNEESLHSKCTNDRMDEERAIVEQNDISSITTCDNLTDPDTMSSANSSQRSLKSTTAEKNLSSVGSDESTMGSTTRSGSSETSRICDDLSVSPHSVESIDSDDSVQWLDLEKPTLSTIEQPIPQRKRHISIGSNESYFYSPSVSSVILQLSDEEEDDDHSVEGASCDLGGITSRRSPQSLNLVGLEAAGDSSGHSADDKTKINGITHLSEFLENISGDLDSTVNDNGIVSLLQSTGNELDVLGEQVRCIECLPGSAESALECDFGDNNIVKSENVSNKVCFTDKMVNGVECLPGSSESALGCECGDNNVLKSENVSNKVLCDETTVNGIECLSESSESTLECECGDNGILKSGNVSDVVPCNEATVNGICFADEVVHPAVQSRPFTLYADDSMSEFRMRTSGSCAVEDAFDRAITEAAVSDNGSEKLQSNGPLAIDKSCSANA